MTETRGQLVVISGPSGSGKTTIIEHLRRHDRVRVSVSATTRPRRDGEVDGRDYHFMTRERFLQMHAEGAFVETNDVFANGHLYGSLKSELDAALEEEGAVYIMEVDVIGARNIREAGHEGRNIFIAPPSPEVLEQRLRARGTDDEAAIERRLGRAAEEARIAEEMGATVILNDDVGRSVQHVLEVMGLEAPA